MSNRPNEVVKPSGLRLASQYKPVERHALVRDQYPATLPFRSTQDLVYCQAILSNGNNFAERTNCDVFELGADGIGDMRTDLGDKVSISRSTGQARLVNTLAARNDLSLLDE